MTYNFKESTYNIFNELSNINIDIPIFNDKILSNLYNYIINLYSNIDLNQNIIKEYSVVKLNNICNNKSILFDFLIDQHNNNNNNNIIYKLTETYTENQREELFNIINTKNFNKCGIWLNQYGYNLLNNIYHLIQSGEMSKEFITKFNHIDKDIYGHFTPLNIQHIIDKKLKYKHIFNIKYEDIKINLIIYNQNKTINNNKLDYLIRRMILMHKISDKKIPINLTLLFVNVNKQINKNIIKILGPKEINSGFTSFSEPKVVIFRNEEMSKLIIHELIHYFRIDFHHFSYNIDNMVNIVNINPAIEIRINESYTEILACIINSVISSYDIYNNKNIKYCRNLICNEIKYNLFNVAKILDYYEFKNTKEFFCKHHDNRFQQNTSVFSYFIVKTALLFSLEEFFKFLNNNTSNLSKTNSNINENYLKLVTKCLKNKQYLHDIDLFLKYIQNNKNMLMINNSKLYNSLRMTMIEIDYDK